jgi:hypothetical protein
VITLCAAAASKCICRHHCLQCCCLEPCHAPVVLCTPSETDTPQLLCAVMFAIITRCGTCGGTGCDDRFPGSESKCCTSAIKASKKLCDIGNGQNAPCLAIQRGVPSTPPKTPTTTPTTPPPQPVTPAQDPNNVYTCTPQCVAPDICAGTKTDPRTYACRTPITCDAAVSCSVLSLLFSFFHTLRFVACLVAALRVAELTLWSTLC